MTQRTVARGSKRKHSKTPRQHRISTAYNDSEFGAICRAAKALGMMPGAYLAKLGSDAANGLLPSAGQSDAVDQMSDAIAAANRIADMLKEAMRGPHACACTPDISAVVGMAAAVASRLEIATLKAIRKLQQ